MTRTLSDSQKKFLRIYDNLRYDADNFTPTAAEPENFGAKLLDDFMQEGGFIEALRSIATDFGRSDMLQTIDTYKPAEGERFGAAEGLVAAVERGDDDMLVDLIKDPQAPTYSLTELNTFWNIAANIQQNDPELYTHLVADKRYVAIFDQTAKANEYEPEGIAKLREDVLKAHEDAIKTLDSIEYDKFQTTYMGMSDNIYSLLENSDFETIGKDLTADAPKTIFSGLEVKKPMTPEALTEVSVPIEEYYEDLQKTKEEFVPPELPQLTGTFNFEAGQTTTASVPEEPEAKADKEYSVEKGDNLWKIAKEEYGLKSYKDIMRAVDHIAQANGLEKGADANHIDVGQKLKLPPADEIKNPIEKLDWVALDADTRRAPVTQQLAFN